MNLLTSLNNKCSLPVLLLVLSLTLVLYSCGLPSYPYLYPPKVAELRTNPDSGDYDLIFSNAYQNNTSLFSGYEVYYKIYDPFAPEDPDTTPVTYISEREKIAASSSANHNTLISMGFNRLFFTTDYSETSFTHNETRPSFKLEQNLLDKQFNIRLKLQQNLNEEDSYFAAVWNNNAYSFPKTYFYRWVKNEISNVYDRKFFGIDNFNINDSDMPESIDSSRITGSESYVYISFYIFSFGRDASNLINTFYSIPEYLGTLKLNCIFNE